jgi:hypothetical protein
MLNTTIVLGGNAGAGKDTFGQFLAERFKALDVSHRLDAYAQTLKEIVHLKYGIPMHILLGDKTVKESTYRYSKSVRRILQDEGEYARQTCGPTVWTDRLFERVSTQQEQVAIICDARHPDEEIIGMKSRLASPGVRFFAIRIVNPRVEVTRGHPSEDLIAAAPDSIFDLLISNDRDLDALRITAHDVADALLTLNQANKTKINRSLVAYSAGADGWPYPRQEDAEAVSNGRRVVSRNFTHLKGTIVSERS